MMFLRAAMVFVFSVILLEASDAASKHARTIQAPHNGPIAIVPADSPVCFVRFDKYGDFNFAGRFVLSGTYYYRVVGKPGMGAYFDPDPEVAARLPTIKGIGVPWEISILNQKAFAAAVDPTNRGAELKKKGGDFVTGRVAIWVDSLYADVSCGTVYWSARFVSVYKPASGPVRSKSNGFDQC
ncbi:MAG: hypothetical protein WCA81_15740 [Rhizomicrobium sp.]